MTGDAAPADPASPSRAKRLRSIIGFMLGVALLGAAVWAVVRRPEELRQALDAASHSPWWLIALALALPLVNWLLMSLSFWILMRRHGPVGLVEMSCLIGAAWLLNYLPLRPGLLGRVAYHKAVNQIPVSKSVAVTFTSIACAGVALLAILGISMLVGSMGPSSPGLVVLLGAAPLAAALTAAFIQSRVGAPAWIAMTLAIRYADLLVWAARYVVAFEIVGHPISPVAGAAIAIVCQIAMLIPLFGNGLGLREWAVGATAAALPEGVMTRSGTLATAVGLAAEIANRVAELAGAIPVGLLSAAWLARRTRAR